MMYEKQCIKRFEDYFSAGALNRDIRDFKESLKERVRNKEIISARIDEIEEDCGWGYAFGVRDFLFHATIYYTILYLKE